MLAGAQTGTGKTAGFVLPILQRLGARKPGAPRALILTPTRELAAQVAESVRHYGKHTGLRSAVIFGGVSERPQIEAMRQGCDILVATPGRLHGSGRTEIRVAGDPWKCSCSMKPTACSTWASSTPSRRSARCCRSSGRT